jgi:signal transduction histidine kinase
MKRKLSFRFLTRITFIYLIFAFIAFISSGIFLSSEADEFIHNSLRSKFNRIERGISYHIKKNNLPEKGGRDEISFVKLDEKPNLDNYPVYSDTVVHNETMDEHQRSRQKVNVIEIEGEYYKISMIKSVEDFLRLKDDIFESLIPAFIILAIGIVLFNYLLSGYYFRAFNKILNTMKTYKIGKGENLTRVKTNTVEFNKMQNLFNQMIDRIEEDYRNLKEYTENMAHEIQTPLAVIRNKTENLLSSESVMNQHSDDIKRIYEETNHLSKLSNKLNLITKIENKEFNNLQKVRTKPQIEKHLESVNELVDLKEHTIETDLSEDHYLNIDPFLLDILLKNLLQNAIKYGSKEGPIRILTDSNKLEVSNYGEPVKQNGDDLFKRFTGNRNHKKSLGLGLSIIKKICDVFNLKITYKYEDNQNKFIIEG